MLLLLLLLTLHSFSQSHNLGRDAAKGALTARWQRLLHVYADSDSAGLLTSL